MLNPHAPRSDTFVMPRRAGEPTRARVQRLMHQPWFDTCLIGLILISCSLAVVEIVLTLSTGVRLACAIAGHTISGLFLGELAIRCWTYRNRSRFFARYWLDIIASLPTPFTGLPLLRLLRLFRLMRVGVVLRRRYITGSGSEFAFILTIAGIVLLGGAAITSYAGAGTGSGTTHHFWTALFVMIAGQPLDGVPESLPARMMIVLESLTGMFVFAVLTGAAAALMTNRLKHLEVHSMDLDELEHHIVICGWDRRAPLVIEELQHSTDERHRALVVIAELEELPQLNWKIVDRERVYLVNGDFTKAEMLEKAGIRRAAKAIILSDKTGNRSDQDRDARTILAALTIEKLNRDIYTCAELLNREHEAHLRMAGVEDVVCASEYGATLMSSMAIHSGISSIMSELLSVQYGNEFFKLDMPAWLEGKTFSEGVAALTHKEAILIAVDRPLGGKRYEISLNPSKEFKLHKGDRLVVISRLRPDITVP